MFNFYCKVLEKYNLVCADYDDDELTNAIDEDYGLIKHEMEQDAKKAVDAIAHLLPWQASQIHIYMIKSSGGRLGFYRPETESRPIILLNPKLIIKTAKTYDVDLYTAIATTFWHELGHAIIALAEASDVDKSLLPKSENEEEDWAEDMADSFWRNSSLTPKIKKILDALRG